MIGNHMNHLFIRCGGGKMFSYQEIKSLNELELEVYNYIIRHQDHVIEMKNQRFSRSCTCFNNPLFYVFAKKLAVMVMSEFKLKYKMYLNQKPSQVKIGGLRNFTRFFSNEPSRDEFNKKLDEVASLLYYSQKIILTGIGNSGVLAKYGARYFSSVWKLAQHIE